ncbi:adaptor protein MecA [Staphylococcus muscae]|uniref:Adapter protein MecA n=1 Tax=Staphylococcus muscae TaxID=1294 RepID=A0A240BZG8_9STAP|nr:adaptor protein MecA [Staphylococcus muscae]AVQ34519.1 adaptor protein MecA [Staphylococcus muscae]PNZ04991.1 adaptor protein MecA [Staphylococcus muscae]GGA90981.1 adapter protein MecA [Staphylococcus muscae]SNW01124.1 adapter protein MecA [Staphylococcus muscae]
MRIERIDDMTVKLFITYTDIEARGFRREDLWTNRKRGEEFFWSVMEEVNEEEDFVVEGPLWIQVHAFEKGVEVTISKSKNESEMGMSEDMNAFEEIDNHLSDLLSQSFKEHDEAEPQNHATKKEQKAQRSVSSGNVPLTPTAIFKFDDLESVIAYAHRHNQQLTQFEDLLYMLDQQYYYVVHFDARVTEDEIHDFYSQMLEFASLSDKTELYLNDYGKIVMSYNVTEQVKRYFTL